MCGRGETDLENISIFLKTFWTTPTCEEFIVVVVFLGEELILYVELLGVVAAVISVVVSASLTRQSLEESTRIEKKWEFYSKDWFGWTLTEWALEECWFTMLFLWSSDVNCSWFSAVIDILKMQLMVFIF